MPSFSSGRAIVFCDLRRVASKKSFVRKGYRHSRLGLADMLTNHVLYDLVDVSIFVTLHTGDELATNSPLRLLVCQVQSRTGTN
jgi:hypothetical protein